MAAATQSTDLEEMRDLKLHAFVRPDFSYCKINTFYALQNQTGIGSQRSKNKILSCVAIQRYICLDLFLFILFIVFKAKVPKFT